MSQAARPRAGRLAIALLGGLGLLGALAYGSREALLRTIVDRNTAAYRAPVAAPRPPGAPTLVRVAAGLTQPTGLVFVPGGGLRALALEKGGRVRLVDLPGQGGLSPPVVQAAGTVAEFAVRTESELGLLGLAFHPRYRENGLVYVHVTPRDGAQRSSIRELFLPFDSLGSTPATRERVVLEVAQPYPNHNGGCLLFGPDGMLYIGIGDGGWRADPHGNGQDLGTLLGKILRIDVDARDAGAYGVPSDNPHLREAGVRPEIFAHGLRNPWRFTFDPHGRLVAGDVGQDLWEEVDLVPRGGNLGWKSREGAHCFAPPEGCPVDGLVEPVFEYGRELGQSITGGVVYEGSLLPDLQGRYVFGDFVSGRVWALKLPGPHLGGAAATEVRELGQFPLLLSSFARDPDGELYAVDYGSGAVFRLGPGGT
ncbi:MAG: PQQ-dependent sugar dehydrogenase [Deltaproteobacteria bacterium]|nr:PQQ-dependent sugar dehydrogenase [Deltaproteobacteria bacterium]